MYIKFEDLDNYYVEYVPDDCRWGVRYMRTRDCDPEVIKRYEIMASIEYLLLLEIGDKAYILPDSQIFLSSLCKNHYDEIRCANIFLSDVAQKASVPGTNFIDLPQIMVEFSERMEVSIV